MRGGCCRWWCFHSVYFSGAHAGGEIGGTDRGARHPFFVLGSLSPVDVLLGAVETGGRDNLDFDVELPLEGCELLAPLILQGVGQLRVELDPDSAEPAGDGTGFNAAQDVEADELGAGDGAGAAARRAVSVPR